MNDCAFCSIIAGDIPAHKVYEDDNYLAFLDIFPASKGHTLVIPKSHHVDIHSIPGEIYGGMAAVSKKVADLLMSKLASEGTSIFQMNREAGWQSVFHVHMHVIPRWSTDALHKPWDIAPADQNELAEIKKLLTE
jgi:histidine triad (HIT) family protein